MNKEYIIILNYNTGEVLYRELNNEDEYIKEYYGDEALLCKYHLNIDECSFMYTSICPTLELLEND